MDGREVLITGGTGSLANALVRYIKQHHKPRGIRLLSRSELRQAQMAQQLKAEGLLENVEFIVGDVRDERKVELATRGVHVIVHAAAMKRVDTAEKDPLECIGINIHGTENVVYQSLKNKAENVILVSTDKAYRPITLYGATKMCAEGLFINGGVYSGKTGPLFSIVRYGNVFASNGSVVEIFSEQARLYNEVTITHPGMTRFWIKLPAVCKFICDRIGDTHQGQLSFPDMVSSSIETLAEVVAPGAAIRYIGMRCNEKLHEEIHEGVHSDSPDFLLDARELQRWIDDKDVHGE